MLALAVVAAGAVGSIGLMLRAAQRPPRLLLVLFTIWVLSPFVALAWANLVSTRWSSLTRAALHAVTLVITLGSLAIYAGLVVVTPAGSANAARFVVVAPGSWVLLAAVVATAAFVSGRRSRRGTHA